MARPRKRAKAGYMISAVAELYKLHPQTLRLYVILTLTRELGVNLAGIEIILNMRDKMSEMQHQMEAFIGFVRGELSKGFSAEDRRAMRNAIVRAIPPKAIHIEK